MPLPRPHPLLVLSLPLLTHAQHYTFFPDPRTAPDCIEYADVHNANETTCDSVIRTYNLDPERFHAWNPSVGLDCTPWPSNSSYCVLTNATWDDAVFHSTTTLTVTDYGASTELAFPLMSLTTNSAGYSIPVTRSGAPVRSTSTRAPIPAPTSWKEMGCFVDTWNDDFDIPPAEWRWILDFRFVPPDPLITVDKCKQRCWEIQYPVAGLKAGEWCYCGDRNNGTRAADQAECGEKCPGGGEGACGGTNRTSVWEAEGYVKPLGEASASGSGSGTGTGGAVKETGTATSGAGRNEVVVFGGLLGLLRGWA